MLDRDGRQGGPDHPRILNAISNESEKSLLVGMERAVEADNGMIGGSMSHEFMVLAETGEETILYDEQGTYVANVEEAEVLPPTDASTEQALLLQPVQTPGTKTVEDVCTFLKISPD